MTKARAAIVLLLTAVLAAGCRQRPESAAVAATFPGAPIIIISIDTLRADRLPAYGYTGVATPAIDALRADSILYRHAWTHSPLTLPSHVSLLTGLLPADHAVRNNIGYRFDGQRHPSIPLLLRQRGYATGAAVSSFVLRGNTGLGALFDFYDDQMPVPSGVSLGDVQREGHATAAVAWEWMGARAEKPFFFLLHLFEPHTPYEPPEPFRSRYSSNPYDGEVAAADDVVGAFLQRLRDAGIYDRAMIILLSDHGEGLNDHGEPEHGVFLYREVIQVPLLVKLPHGAGAGSTVDEPVGLFDLAPTILAATGVEAPVLPGVSLLQTPPRERAIFSETMYPRIHFGWSELRSLVDATHHYIDAPRVELYDIVRDPAERENLAAADRRRTSSMRQAIEPFRRDLQTPMAIDPEEAARLAALGYLSAGTTTPSGPLTDPKDAIGILGLLADARAHAERGEQQASIAAYEKVVEDAPRLTDGWSHLAQAYERAGLLEKATRAYRTTISLSPSLAPQVALSIAAVELKLNRLDEAAGHAELALKNNPAGASLILGRVALARGDLAGAENHAANASSEPSWRARAQILLAQVRVAQKRPEEALRIADAVLAAAGGTPPDLLAYVRGDALARLGRMAEAEAAFRSEIERYPGNREAYVRLAVLLILQSKPAAASAVMESMVRRHPDPSSYELAAGTFRHFGQAELAGRWARRRPAGEGQKPE